MRFPTTSSRCSTARPSASRRDPDFHRDAATRRRRRPRGGRHATRAGRSHRAGPRNWRRRPTRGGRTPSVRDRPSQRARSRTRRAPTPGQRRNGAPRTRSLSSGRNGSPSWHGSRKRPRNGRSPTSAPAVAEIVESQAARETRGRCGCGARRRSPPRARGVCATRARERRLSSAGRRASAKPDPSRTGPAEDTTRTPKTVPPADRYCTNFRRRLRKLPRPRVACSAGGAQPKRVAVPKSVVRYCFWLRPRWAIQALFDTKDGANAVRRTVGDRYHGRGAHRRLALTAAGRLSFRRTSARGLRRDVDGISRLPRARRLHRGSATTTTACTSPTTWSSSRSCSPQLGTCSAAEARVRRCTNRTQTVALSPDRRRGRARWLRRCCTLNQLYDFDESHRIAYVFLAASVLMMVLSVRRSVEATIVLANVGGGDVVRVSSRTRSCTTTHRDRALNIAIAAAVLTGAALWRDSSRDSPSNPLDRVRTVSPPPSTPGRRSGARRATEASHRPSWPIVSNVGITSWSSSSSSSARASSPAALGMSGTNSKVGSPTARRRRARRTDPPGSAHTAASSASPSAHDFVASRCRSGSGGSSSSGERHHDTTPDARDRDRLGVLRRRRPRAATGCRTPGGRRRSPAAHGARWRAAPCATGRRRRWRTPPRRRARPARAARPASPTRRASVSPGLAVTISTRSASLNAPPSACSFHVAATFSSPSTFRVPDGVQSDPRHTRSPAARAASTSVVPP